MPTLIASWATTYKTYDLSSGTERVIRAQSFQTPSSGATYLDSVQFYMCKGAAPTNPTTDKIRAKLYTHAGTFPTGSYGTSPVLATSNEILANDLSTEYNLITFQFDGTYQLQNSTNYVIGVDMDADATSDVYVGCDTTTMTASGCNSSGYSEDYPSAANNARDLVYYVYQTDVPPTLDVSQHESHIDLTW